MKNGTWMDCYKCKTEFFIPEALNTAALAARGEIPFFCPYGHRQVYVVGETEAIKLRRERDILKQQLAQRDDVVREWQEAAERNKRVAITAKGQLTKLRKRVQHGVCIHCNRTFSNVARHMATCHAHEADAPDISNVVPLDEGKKVSA